MVRRIVLSLVIVATIAFAGASQAEARHCSRGGYRGGYGGGYGGGYRSASYYNGPSYYYGGGYGHRARYYGGYRGGYYGGYRGGYYGGRGVSFSFGY